MAGHVRTTISIPPDLKARMDAVSESVNWSAVAAQAFEQKLAEILKRKGTTNMTEAIERLRASKQIFGNEEYHSGFEAGRKWAMERAEAWELTRLDAWRVQLGSLWDRNWEDNPKQGNSPSELFVFHIHPDDDDDRAAAVGFWLGQGIFTEPLTGEFVRGYAHGALDVWSRV